jgi:hypothetical protein
METFRENENLTRKRDLKTTKFLWKLMLLHKSCTENYGCLFKAVNDMN